MQAIKDRDGHHENKVLYSLDKSGWHAETSSFFITCYLPIMVPVNYRATVPILFAKLVAASHLPFNKHEHNARFGPLHFSRERVLIQPAFLSDNKINDWRLMHYIAIPALPRFAHKAVKPFKTGVS